MVSDQGRVMRVPHWKTITKGGVRSYGGQPWYGVWDGNRYILMHKRKTYRVARLVCEAFKGPPKPGRGYCLHGDENARNNKASNLSWGTQKENLNAPGFLKYCSSRTGDKSTYAKGKRARAASAGMSM